MRQIRHQATDKAAGKVLLQYGTVTAGSGGTIKRILHPGDPVFAGEEICTGHDGMISIIFSDSDQTRLDLGRSSTVVLDNEVTGIADPQDSIVHVTDIEQALANTDFDPSLILAAPAAGDNGGSGGGGTHPYIVFTETGLEIIPDSGAETTSLSREPAGPPEHVEQDTLLQPIEPNILVPTNDVIVLSPPEPPQPATITQDGGSSVPLQPATPPDPHPVAGDMHASIAEDDLPNGSDPDKEPVNVNGDLNTLGIVPGDGLHTITFANGQSITLDGNGDAITIQGQYGLLDFHDDGTWSFTLPDQQDHPIANATGINDHLDDLFSYTITDVDGDSAGGTMTFAILDDGPVAASDSDSVLEGERVSGNVITGEKNGIQAPGLGPDQFGADTPGHISSFTYTDAQGRQQTASVAENHPTSVITEHGQLTMYANGDYDYQARPFHHGINSTHSINGQQDTITYVLTDNDGDTAQTTLTFNVEDDVPVTGTLTQNAILDIEDGNSVTGMVDINYGADGPAQLDPIRISSYPTDAQGFAVDDNGNQLLTVGGNKLVYTDDGHGGLFAYETYPNGQNANNPVFHIELDSDSTYTIHYNNGFNPNDNHHVTYELTATDDDGSDVRTDITVTFDDHDGTITGTNANEAIAGSNSQDRILARGGDDTIYGRDGADTINGGDGLDTIYGGDGDDTLSGGSGDDTLNGGEGVDTLRGGTGDDVLFGGDGGDKLNGQRGNDTLYGEGGDDTLRGGIGDDVLFGGDGGDKLIGQRGNDTLYGDGGDDTLRGGTGDDVLVGGDGGDKLIGQRGNDTLFGGEETGGDGQDRVSGGPGKDTFVDVNNDDDSNGGDIATDFSNDDQNLDSLTPPPEPVP